MWTDPDVGRSDFILAAAALLLGRFAIELVASLPLYPGGLAASLLQLVWIWVLTGLVPVLLARYRGSGADAFALTTDRTRAGPGLLLALPVVAVAAVRGLANGTVASAMLGRVSAAAVPDPTISPGGIDVVQIVLAGLGVVVLWLGTSLLLPFLTTQASSGFRGTDMDLTAALRTFGTGAAGAGLVLGLLKALGSATGWLSVLVSAGGLLAVVLMVDRMVPPKTRTARATILAPAIVILGAFLLATGGLLGGDLLAGLYGGTLAAGVAVVVAVLVEARRTWAAVPLLAALSVYPTCMGPLPFLDTLLAC